ncbi:MAG: glycosyltransferase, partial [Verrucomicrobiota bacterium]
MLNGKKIIVVMPAYNAAQTIVRTHGEVLETGVVDGIIVVDDASRDETAAIARALPLTQVYVHEKNKGYGANQKTCYKAALENGADVVIMV